MYIWGHDRRFNAYSNYIKNIFGERVQKVSINAGFTCPNRDGSMATGGCTFCNNEAFNPSYCDPGKSITDQIREGITFHQKRYKGTSLYLAYFQAYSNTYHELETLERMYKEALNVEGIIGIVIGTRPDCVDSEKLDFFKELAMKTYLVIEYGIESCYNGTLEKVNRGHSFEDTLWAVHETANRNIITGGHIIFGLPGETQDEMLQEAIILSQLPLNNLKLHQLQIIKNTVMAKEYNENQELFNLFSLDEYMQFMVRFIERLNPRIVIERIAGEAPPRMVDSSFQWKIRNDQIVARFEKELKERDTWQGRLFKQKED